MPPEKDTNKPPVVETPNVVEAPSSTPEPAPSSEVAKVQAETAANLAETNKVVEESVVKTQTQEAAGEVKKTVESTVPATGKEGWTSNIEQLSEQQKADEIVSTFQKLHTEIQPDNNGNIILTPEQLQMFERIDQLRKPSLVPLSLSENKVSERTLLVENKSLRKDTIKELKKEIKAEKKAKNDLEKIAKLEAELANIKNHNNYSYSKASVLNQINQALDTGVYINTPLAFLPENQPLIIDLYKNCKKLKGKNLISLPYQGREIVVYNGSEIQKKYGYTDEYIRSCGGYANIVEKWITENTKMNQGQARNMVNTLGTVGMIGGIILLWRWLFTEKDKEGNRKFGFSFWKLAALVGIPLAVNYGSQMVTGKSFMANLEKAWKTGEMPWETKGLAQATENEKMALGLNTVQFALLGVPYSVLAQGVNPKTGLVSSMNTKILEKYYTDKIEEAKANNDTKAESIFKSQLEAVKSIDTNKDAKNLFNTAVANMQVDAGELSDPNKQSETLNEKIYQKSERYQQFDAYLKSKNVIPNPEKEVEVEITKRLFAGTSPLKDSDFEAMLKEGLLISNDATAQEIRKLSLPDQEKSELIEGFNSLANIPDITSLSLEVLDPEHIKVKSHNQEIVLNPKEKTLEWFTNSAGQKLPFKNQKELLEVACLLNSSAEKIKDMAVRHPWAKEGLRKSFKDWLNWSSPENENRPFYIDTTGSISFNGLKGQTIVNDLSPFPFFTEMNRKYPTINANKQYFVNYLNTHQKLRLNAK